MFNLFLAVPADPLPFIDTIWPAVMFILGLSALGYLTKYKILLLITLPFIVAQAVDVAFTDTVYSVGLVSLAFVNAYVALWRPSEV